MSDEIPPMPSYRPSPRREMSTGTKAVLAIVAVLLLLKWEGTAAAWKGHGCTENPYVLALMRGEPQWYEVCLKKDTQESLEGER